MDAMDIKGTAKRKMTVFLLKMGKLYRSAQTRLHAIFLRISMVFTLVTKVINQERSHCRIALAQKRVVNRFYYPCRFALFRLGSAFWLQGS